MADTRLFLCGRLAIESPGGTILEQDFPARQGRLLWANLAASYPKPVARIGLAEAIWDQELPDTWDETLSGIVSRLRQLLNRKLGPNSGIAIVSETGRYQLRLPTDTFVDLNRARFGLHNAESALRIHDLSVALSESRVAMEIAARGFLEGEHIGWIARQRGVLRDIQFRGAECTIEAELERGNNHLALEEATRLIELDPLNEPAYRFAMIASERLGKRGNIARLYQSCVVALRDLATLEPATETTELYEQLRGQEDTPRRNF